jgi:putative ABC transport system substrate-binding protein
VPLSGADVSRRIPRIGVVFNSAPLGAVQREKPAEPVMRGFLQGLRESGYTEGGGVIIERRSAEGNLERLETIIRDLAELPVDVIVVSGNAATLAARKVTATIPVVSAGMATPVELGIAASLARPGGNVTGLVPAFGRELPMKRLELLRELLPDARRVAYFGTRPAGELPEDIRSAAATMGLTLVFVDARLPRVEAGLAELERQGTDALIVAPLTPLYVHQRTIAEFAARIRLPDIYGFQEAVEAGGLASYGIDSHEAWRRAARYVGRILDGAKPGDLPIEQMDRYRLVLNRKRARQLDIAIPRALLQRADEVIE